MKVKTITCPNCGHANNFLADECTQCGINFSRYYDELEKAETLRHHIEEQEKAEAREREQEEQAQREAEARQREAEKKAEALRRQQEEQERLQTEARRKQEKERQHREEEEQTRIEAERRKEAQKREDILRRQKEALEKAETLKRQQEEKEEEEIVARQPEHEAEKEAALKREEEPTRPAAETSQHDEEGPQGEEHPREDATDKATQNRVPDTPDEEGAIESADTDPADIEEQARAFDYIEYPPENEVIAAPPVAPDRPASRPTDFRPAASLEERLRIYTGRMIGLNYGNPAEIQNVKLLAVSRDHFQVFYPISQNIVSFSYGVIVSITENADGVSAVGPDISPVFPVVVELPRPFFHVH